MRMRAKITLALAGVLMATAWNGAMAQICPPGYAYSGGVCQPVTRSYSNPVSGAASGEAAGAATGNSAAGPVGAIVGGAIGTATGTVTGTANMLTGGAPPPTCARGYAYYNGGCYPAR